MIYIDTKKHPWIIAAVITLVSICFQIYNNAPGFILSYHRNEFISSSWWQWLTPNLVHLSWSHWLLNILNLFALIILFPDSWRGKRFLGIFVSASLVLIWSLYLFSPEVSYYAGMSGVLYTMAVYGALHTIRIHPATAFLVLFYIIIKLFAHDWINSMMDIDKMLKDMPIVTDIHWYGSFFGIFVYIFFLIIDKLQKLFEQ